MRSYLKKLMLCNLLLVSALFATCQKLIELSTGNATSIRGLSVVDNRTIWVSGSAGAVGRSTDAGKTWKWFTVKGFEKREFRDIEAFDAATAIVMAIAEPAQILKTVDGGETWKLIYENNSPGMFLDAMEFWNPQSGIVLGDPINGRFFIARTFDEGATWKEIDSAHLPRATKGEACFASSGTNIRSLDRDEACFISGGMESRYFTRDSAYPIPFVKGSESTGANSIAVRNNKKRKGKHYLVVVGGDYRQDTARTANCFISNDNGRTWKAPVTSPFGYRSSVEFISKNKVICAGTSGVDLSDDGGMHWKNISSEGFHVCRKAKEGSLVVLAGSKGRIFQLDLKAK
ncbi:MAG: oxidoreductase [Chitinophagaceae bacterium]